MITKVNSIRDNFNLINNKLHSIIRNLRTDEPYPVLTNHRIKNKDIIGKSMLKTSPVPVLPYLKIMEKKFNFKFPENVKVTTEDIIKQDEISLNQFSKPNFDLSKFNFNRLLKTQNIVNELMGFTSIKSDKISIESSIMSFPNSTSSAYPLYKRKDDDNVRLRTKLRVEEYLSNPTKDKLLKLPCTVFHRFQYKNKTINDKFYPKDRISKSGLNFPIEKKIRQVWALPFTVHTIEGVLLRDLVNKVTEFQKLQLYPVFTSGRNLHDISRDVIQQTKFNSKKSNCKISSIDVSSYDQNIPSFMWSFFNSSLKLTIDPSDYKILDDLTTYWCFTPYIYNKPKKGLKSIPILNQMRGTPSGSLITNLFNTYVNLFVNVYAILERNNDNVCLNSIRMSITVLGDDNLSVTDLCDQNHLINVYKRFDLTVSPEKCVLVNHKSMLPFLGYIWDNNNRPQQSISWYITHFSLPSTFIDLKKFTFGGKELNVYRCVSVFMPLFNGLLNFNYLIGKSDYVWKKYVSDYINEGIDPEILITSGDTQVQWQRIPMNLILNGSWDEYSNYLDTLRNKYKTEKLNNLKDYISEEYLM